ncbi:MAG: FtsX-like permease family protein [Gammaproteobacteria bacterium]|nr:FtsX-like permease family protein [Gammaproteobacteria bacterium]
MTPLDRKLLRDLRRLWLQAVAVGVVLGCGIAIFVMATGMYGSLEVSRDQYYARSLMADLAGSLVRAPDRIAADLAAEPGVAGLEARASGVGLLSIEGVTEPVSARLVSLPAERRPRVNDLVLKRGRWPVATRSAEVLVNESFAEAHSIEPGQRLPVLIRGQRKIVEVTGIASSPEFVFAVAPGDILPEPRRFGVLWMNREVLGRALDLDGAFNDVVLRLQGDADRNAVIASLDAQLARYGGRGLYGRDRMLSARYLSDELSQLRTLASILPPIFLLVAVFLINVMLSRLVATERANIGLLKAFGYPNITIGAHYAKFALAFCLAAAVLGIVLGTYVGGYMASVYQAVYHLPELDFEAGPLVYLGAFVVALVAAVLGALAAVRRAVSLAPAVALAPPAPTSFRRLGEHLGQKLRALDARSRMLARRILRFPRRSATTVTGIALALALLIMSEHFPIAIERIISINFGTTQRMDVTLTFAEREHERVLREVARLPGVLQVEPLRTADVFLSAGSRREREAVLGISEGAMLNRIVSTDLEVIEPTAEGLTLSAGLVRKLNVRVGDDLRLEATDGRRVESQVRVVRIVQPFLGSAAYMERKALGRLLREPDRVDSAYLIIDAAFRDRLSTRLKEIPAIVGATFADNAERSLRQLFEQGAGFFAFMFLLFSLAMAAGVALSAARVTLGEQERDLATLRVLGFRRREASWVLLGELAVLLAVALPLGLILGAALSRWMMEQFETDLFSFPFVFDLPTYARSALFIVVAVVLATLWVRRDVHRLDLVGVLKSRE